MKFLATSCTAIDTFVVFRRVAATFAKLDMSAVTKDSRSQHFLHFSTLLRLQVALTKKCRDETRVAAGRPHRLRCCDSFHLTGHPVTLASCRPQRATLTE